MIRSSLVVAVMLAAGPALAQEAADDLTLLPVDSEMVAGLDFQQAQKTTLWKQFVAPQLAKGDLKEGLAKFKKTCGVDPMKIVTTIAIGLKGIGEEQPDGVIVAHGVPKAKLLACYDKMTRLKQSNGEITRDGDVLLITKKGDPSVGLAFVDDSTAIIVVGTAATGAGIRAITKGESALKTSPKFVDIYKRTNTKDTLWLIMNGTSKGLDNLRQAGIQPKVLFGSVKITKDVSLDLRAQFATADEAKNVAALAQGQLKDAAAMFDKVSVDATATELKIAILLSDAKLKALLKQIKP